MGTRKNKRLSILQYLENSLNPEDQKQVEEDIFYTKSNHLFEILVETWTDLFHAKMNSAQTPKHLMNTPDHLIKQALSMFQRQKKHITNKPSACDMNLSNHWGQICLKQFNHGFVIIKNTFSTNVKNNACSSTLRSEQKQGLPKQFVFTNDYFTLVVSLVQESNIMTIKIYFEHHTFNLLTEQQSSILLFRSRNQKVIAGITVDKNPLVFYPLPIQNYKFEILNKSLDLSIHPS